MYDVDFSFRILVSRMTMICGSLCSVHARSRMPRRLELMHHVFHMITFRVEAWWLSASMLVVGVWLVLVCLGGWS